MEDLALGLGVSVVASLHLAVAGEGGVGNLGEDGVVVSGHPGNVLLEAPRPGLRVTVVPLQVPGGWTVLARHKAHHGGQRCGDQVEIFTKVFTKIIIVSVLREAPYLDTVMETRVQLQVERPFIIVSLTPLVCKYHRILTKGVKTPHVSPDVMVVWRPRDTGRWAAMPCPLYTLGHWPGPGQQGALGHLYSSGW